MSDVMRVGVSRATWQELGDAPFDGVRLVPVPGGASDATVLWRRQADRTAWLLDAVEGLPGLRWIHCDTTGVDRLPLDRFAERGIVLSNGRAAHAAAVSEWAFAAMLLAAKNLHETVRDSDEGRWEPHANDLELRGSTVGVLGLGAIGSAVARLCAAAGMTVVGVSRSGRPVDGVVRVTRIADVLASPSGWADALAGARFLVACLPETPETRGLVDDGALDALRPGSWLVNVGRGSAVVEPAVVAAIAAGRLGGAVLDAVGEEPLAATSPLRGIPSVIVSPHTASFTDRTLDRTRAVFASELERHRAGLPPANLVDLEKGY